MTTQQPLYRIVYADGTEGMPQPWPVVLRLVRFWLRKGTPEARPVRVERVSPAPRATGDKR
jgi:hypothetical protein